MDKKVLSLSQIIERRREKLRLRRGYVQLAFRLLLLAAVVWLLMTQVFLLTQVKGNAMFPALKDGDLVFAFRLQSEYRQDDVVIYENNGETQVGRVIAKEGDVVTLDDSGTLTVNGTVQDGEIVYPTYAKEGLDYPLRVPEGTMFLLGDYRTQAKDSRDFGPVPLSEVEGKVITILRRRGI